MWWSGKEKRKMKSEEIKKWLDAADARVGCWWNGSTWLYYFVAECYLRGDWTKIVIQVLLSQQILVNVVFNWSIVVFGWIWITVWVLLSQRIVFDTMFDWIWIAGLEQIVIPGLITVFESECWLDLGKAVMYICRCCMCECDYYGENVFGFDIDNEQHKLRITVWERSNWIWSGIIPVGLCYLSA